MGEGRWFLFLLRSLGLVQFQGSLFQQSIQFRLIVFFFGIEIVLFRKGQRFFGVFRVSASFFMFGFQWLWLRLNSWFRDFSWLDVGVIVYLYGVRGFFIFRYLQYYGFSLKVRMEFYIQSQLGGDGCILFVQAKKRMVMVVFSRNISSSIIKNWGGIYVLVILI